MNHKAPSGWWSREQSCRVCSQWFTNHMMALFIAAAKNGQVATFRAGSQLHFTPPRYSSCAMAPFALRPARPLRKIFIIRISTLWRWLRKMARQKESRTLLW